MGKDDELDSKITDFVNFKTVALLQDVVKELKKLQEDGISVDNLDVIKQHLRVENRAVSKNLTKDISSIGKEIVKSFEAIPKAEIALPLKFAIPGIDLLAKKLEALSGKNFNPKIEIKHPDIQIPEIIIPKIELPKIIVPPIRVDTKPPNVTVTPTIIMDIKKLLKALDPLKFISDRSGKPISVRMSNGKKFIKAMQRLADTNEQQMIAYGQSNGLTIDEAKEVASPPKSFSNKRVTVTTAGAPHNLSSGTTSEGAGVACEEVYITGQPDFDGWFAIGGSNAVRAANATANGIIIIPGNVAVVIRTSDLKNLWVDASANGGAICVSYSIRS